MTLDHGQEHAKPAPPVDFYDSTYGRFDQPPYLDIRRETWGEDMGQNSWITADEQDLFIEWLAVGPDNRLLDIACGSGGPLLRIAERTTTTVVGVDIHAEGINAGRRRAEAHQLSDRASFEVVDASGVLPFPDHAFDALMCIDAINHLAQRPTVLSEWARVLKPGGHVLFTDPCVVTGPISNDEFAVRGSVGYYLFVSPETNTRMLADAGLRLTIQEDMTEALAATASNWHAARSKRAAELERIEGDATFQGQQHFLDMTARLARERRLSRLAYLATKPS